MYSGAHDADVPCISYVSYVCCMRDSHVSHTHLLWSVDADVLLYILDLLLYILDLLLYILDLLL